jgi:hypothetical protein
MQELDEGKSSRRVLGIDIDSGVRERIEHILARLAAPEILRIGHATGPFPPPSFCDGGAARG